MNYNYKCVEIFDKDDIKDYFKLDYQIIENPKMLYGNNEKDIFLINYQNGNEFFFLLAKY
jgi:hypothetical protein